MATSAATETQPGRALGPLAARHLMTHFGPVGEAELPIYVRGEGCYVWDDDGPALSRRALDALLRQRRPRPRGARRRGRRAGARARLRDDLGRGASARRSSSRRASPASRPATSNRVFFTSGGSESVETALKFARTLPPAPRRAARRQGDRPRAGVPRHDVRGAVSATGLPSVRTPFEPLDARRLPRPAHRLLPHPGGRGPAVGRRRDRAADPVRGPETVAAVILEPVQNSGGCLPPPAGYFARVREICDRHGRAADLRRHDLLVGPPRHLVRRPALRLRARHHHDGEGH